MSTKTAPGTPSWLRVQNEQAALRLLLDHGVLTRSRIGELSGLSKPTASQIVSRLEGLGIIHAIGSVSGGRGPNAISYGVRADRTVGVAIDVDESVIRSTVVDVHGSEHPVAVTRFDAEAEPPKSTASTDVRRAVSAACTAAAIPTRLVQSVIIGLQGAIDPRTDELSFIDTLPTWPRRGLKAQLNRDLGIQVHIENDVNLATIAERLEGAGADSSSFALLWLGEGLGVAVDQSGVVQRGIRGGAGEIGYLPVPGNANGIDPDATQPDAKDLQGLIGGDAIFRITRDHRIPGEDYPSAMAALAMHPARDAVLQRIAPLVAVGVIPVLAILDPELVVLGGPLGIAGGEPLADLVRDEIARTTQWSPSITGSAVAHPPVLRGARQVLRDQVRTQLFTQLGTLS